MNIAICDDDMLMANQIEKYITEYFKRSKLKPPVIHIFGSGEELLAKKAAWDIVFLDIEMPGLSGTYVGRELKKTNPKVIIIIITSFMEYLDEAMRFHVFRYLSKPLDKERLFRNMKDAISMYTSSVEKVGIETKEGVHTILTSDIILIEARERKVTVRTAAADYLSTHTIEYWQDRLDIHCFFRTHRSYIVNFEHISDFNHSLIYLWHNQYEAYLTRRKYTQFKEAYLLYLESIR